MGRAQRIRFIFLAAAAAAIIYFVLPTRPGVAGALRAPDDRRVLPDFTLPVVGGGEWRLAAHRGRVVLVNFWATWCPPCRRETPDLVALHKRYNGRGFSVVGVSLDDEPRKVVPAFQERFSVPYPLLAPTAGFALADQVQSLPTTFLVDREGRIARTYVGAVSAGSLAADIEALLGE